VAVREIEVLTPEVHDTIAPMGWGTCCGSYLPHVIDPQELGISMGRL
jgi:hypothetical protein